MRHFRTLYGVYKALLDSERCVLDAFGFSEHVLHTLCESSPIPLEVKRADCGDAASAVAAMDAADAVPEKRAGGHGEDRLRTELYT